MKTYDDRIQLYKTVFSSIEGVEILKDLQEQFRLYEENPANDPRITHQRDVILWIMRMVKYKKTDTNENYLY
jgi:hypothetical protein